MKMQRCQPISNIRHQRGVMTLLAVLTLMSSILFLALAVDTGRIFYEKRSLQKNADLAALETSLLYCRDQTMDSAARLAIAQDVLSATRNNFLGTSENITVNLGRVSALTNGQGNTVTDENGNTTKVFTTDPSGKAIQVILNYDITASIFELFTPNGRSTITVSKTGVASACQPIGKLSIRSTLTSITPTQSDILNAVLGDFIDSNLSITAAGWDSLLGADLNVKSLLDGVGADLGIEAGKYDEVLALSIDLGDLLNITADVLEADGNLLAATTIRNIALAVPAAIPAVQIGQLLSAQAASPDEALDVSIQAMQFVQGSLQLANSESAFVADVPVNLLGLAGSTIRIKVIEAPQVIATGNPQDAKNDPYGEDQIYVRTGQVRTFISVDLPFTGPALAALQALFNDPAVSAISSSVNNLLSLNLTALIEDISCFVACGPIESDVTDIQVLPTPRLDISFDLGQGEARVNNYNCNTSGAKSLTVEATSSTANMIAGKMGSTKEAASTNAFSNTEPSAEALALVDIGSIRARKTCFLGICSYQYRKSDGTLTSDRSLAKRTAYSGGGIGFVVDSDLLASTENLIYENSTAESFLPEVDDSLTDDAFQSTSSNNFTNSIPNTLSDIDLQYYPPAASGTTIEGNSLGSVSDPATAAIVSAFETAIDALISPIIDPILNQLMEVLGVSVTEAEVGGALTCESNRVELTI
jgi:uncharacterized membrane protein